MPALGRRRLTQLRGYLEKLDHLLDSYDPPEATPTQTVREILEARARQAPVFHEAIALATKALMEFPLHPALLLRRARARRAVVGADFGFPHVIAAEDDLRTALEVDPNNLEVAHELLDLVFTHSGTEDGDAAEAAGALAEKVTRMLRQFLALQIRAHAYAGDHFEADLLYERWSEVFPDSSELEEAYRSALVLRPDDAS